MRPDKAGEKVRYRKGGGCIPHSKCNPFGHSRENKRKMRLEKACESKTTKTEPAKSEENTLGSDTFIFGNFKKEEVNPVTSEYSIL